MVYAMLNHAILGSAMFCYLPLLAAHNGSWSLVSLLSFIVCFPQHISLLRSAVTVFPVVGVPLKAWFANISGEHQDDQVLALQHRCLPCGIFERNDSMLHAVRVLGVR